MPRWFWDWAGWASLVSLALMLVGSVVYSIAAVVVTLIRNRGGMDDG